MREDPTVAILASCLADGLVLLDGNRAERLDPIPSAGLVGGQTLARALHAPAETARAGTVVLEGGRRLRVDGLTDPHQLAWDGGELAAVATLANAVLWIDRHARVVRGWRAPGEGDCWHLSGLAVGSGRMVATAFGRFARHRDWAEQLRHDRGLVLELPSGRIVATGLSSPHSPSLVDGALVVCDSGRGDLLVGERRVHLGSWTRGIAVMPRHLVVGVSARRGRAGCAHVAFVRRSDLAVERRVALPVCEIFDLLDVDASRSRAFALDDPPLPATVALRTLRVCVTAPRSATLRAGSTATLRCTITNLADAPIAAAPPFPVSVAADWRAGRALWSPVPPLEPGATAKVDVRVLAPEQGRHTLRLRLVQEHVGWLEGEARIEVLVT